MGPHSRRDSYLDNGEDKVDMAEREETNKRDRGNISLESVEDDQKSPQHKKTKVIKDAEKKIIQ